MITKSDSKNLKILKNILAYFENLVYDEKFLTEEFLDFHLDEENEKLIYGPDAKYTISISENFILLHNIENRLISQSINYHTIVDYVVSGLMFEKLEKIQNKFELETKLN